MSLTLRTTALSTTFLTIFASCQPRPESQDAWPGSRAHFSSITMPISDKLKTYMGADKINAFSLNIAPSACDAGVTGTTVDKVATKLELAGSTILSEKLRQGCAYTLTLSLGKADASGSKLEKIYLTNEAQGKKTEVPIEKTRVAKILITAILYVTEDGKKDLKIEGQTVPVPSVTDSDAEIGVDIAQNAAQVTQQTDPASLAGLEKVRGKSFCRKVGSLESGPTVMLVDTCLNFKENGVGDETDVSSGIPQKISFKYAVTTDKVTVAFSNAPIQSFREYALAANGRSISLKEGTNMLIWTKGF